MESSRIGLSLPIRAHSNLLLSALIGPLCETALSKQESLSDEYRFLPRDLVAIEGL